MKHFLITSLFALCSCLAFGQSRSGATVTVNEANVDCVKPTVNILTAPLIADISVGKDRVVYVEKEAFRDIVIKIDDLPALKSIALSNAVKKYNCDLFIGVNISVSTNAQGELEITVIGYPANYTNFRNATEVEVETACKARMATEGRQVDPTVADENPTILKKQ